MQNMANDNGKGRPRETGWSGPVGSRENTALQLFILWSQARPEMKGIVSVFINYTQIIFSCYFHCNCKMEGVILHDRWIAGSHAVDGHDLGRHICVIFSFIPTMPNFPVPWHVQSFFSIVAKFSQFLERHHSSSLGKKKICLGALKSEKKEVEGGNSALLSSGEASYGVLCPLLGPSVQESPGVNPQEGSGDVVETETPQLWGRLRELGLFRAEEVCEGVLSTYISIWRMEPGSSWWCQAIGWEAASRNWNKGRPTWTRWKTLLWWWLSARKVAQRGAGVSLTGYGHPSRQCPK